MEIRDNGKKELIIDMSELFDNTPLTIEEIDEFLGAVPIEEDEKNGIYDPNKIYSARKK
jgi:hypothetical protein